MLLVGWYQAPAAGDTVLVPTASDIRIAKNINNKLHPVPNNIHTQDRTKAVQEANAYDQAQAVQATAALAAQQAQAALDQAANAAPAPQPAQVPISGNCALWLQQAGVTDIADAMMVINRESGCNPNAVNTLSGACGVAQELPCGKSGCSLGDGPCEVRWMNDYVLSRYGSWLGAVEHEQSQGWY